MPSNSSPGGSLSVALGDEKDLPSEVENKDDLLTFFTKWYEYYIDATSDWYGRKKKDYSFYNGDQWTEEETTKLKGRGQPVLTRNIIKKRVKEILGDEVRTRKDPRAEPRNPSSSDDAEVVDDVLRYIADRQKIPRLRGRVAKDLAVVGQAAAFVELDRKSKEPKIKQVRWDRFWYDPHSRELDFSDAGYLGVVTWMDRKDAIHEYPEKADIIEDTVYASGSSEVGSMEQNEDQPTMWADKARDRVKVFEVYWREGHDWYYAHFVKGGILVDRTRTGIMDEREHHVCPLIAASIECKEDGERYGIVRDMVSPQEAVNKRESKALHQMNARQLMTEKGAFNNLTETREQLARPDGIIERNPKKEAEIVPNTDLAQGQLQLGQIAENFLQGPQLDFNLANAESGTDFVERQRAAARQFETFFDELRDWLLRVYRVSWLISKKFLDDERWIRVRDDMMEKGHRFRVVNRSMTKAQKVQELTQQGTDPISAFAVVGEPQAAQAYMEISQMVQGVQQQAQQAGQQVQTPDPLEESLKHPDLQKTFKDHELAVLDVDIILDEAPDNATVEREGAKEITDMMTAGHLQLPPDAVIEASSLHPRIKRKILKRLQEEAQKPNPAAEMQMQQLQLQNQLMQAEIQSKAAEAQQSQAELQVKMAEADTKRQEMEAKVQKMEAEIQKLLSEARVKIPAEGMKDVAQANRLGSPGPVPSLGLSNNDN